jgi:hypothetical protein
MTAVLTFFQRRMAFLRKGFHDSGFLPPPKGQQEPYSRATRGPEDALRPGRFMSTLAMTQKEMGKDGYSVDELLLERLEAIRWETVKVLEDVVKDLSQEQA